MNCDTAFDLLTDPDGSRSLVLARHLDDCPRCRQMQETLAPALEFLTAGGMSGAGYELAAALGEATDSVARQPFVTVEALDVARQAAAELTERAEIPRVRRQQLAAQSLRYAAVFAAGVIVAVALFEMNERAAPIEKQCTRAQAALDDRERPAAEIRALVHSCAACHDAPGELPEHRSTSLKLGRAGEYDWLELILREETLLASYGNVADPNRYPGLPGSKSASVSPAFVLISV
jgi:cytochrome c553